MLSVELKQIAKDRLEEFLLEHQQKRKEVEDKIQQFMKENDQSL